MLSSGKKSCCYQDVNSSNDPKQQTEVTQKYLSNCTVRDFRLFFKDRIPQQQYELSWRWNSRSIMKKYWETRWNLTTEPECTDRLICGNSLDPLWLELFSRAFAQIRFLPLQWTENLRYLWEVIVYNYLTLFLSRLCDICQVQCGYWPISGLSATNCISNSLLSFERSKALDVGWTHPTTEDQTARKLCPESWKPKHQMRVRVHSLCKNLLYVSLSCVCAAGLCTVFGCMRVVRLQGKGKWTELSRGPSGWMNACCPLCEHISIAVACVFAHLMWLRSSWNVTTIITVVHKPDNGNVPCKFRPWVMTPVAGVTFIELSCEATRWNLHEYISSELETSNVHCELVNKVSTESARVDSTLMTWSFCEVLCVKTFAIFCKSQMQILGKEIMEIYAR